MSPLDPNSQSMRAKYCNPGHRSPIMLKTFPNIAPPEHPLEGHTTHQENKMPIEQNFHMDTNFRLIFEKLSRSWVA